MRKDDPKRGTNDRTQEQERYDRTLKTVIINEENEPKHSGFLTKKESMEARDSSIFFLSIKKQKQNHSTPNPQFYVQKKHPLGMRWRQACSWVRGTEGGRLPAELIREDAQGDFVKGKERNTWI